jgi:hypothetical protein
MRRRLWSAVSLLLVASACNAAADTTAPTTPAITPTATSPASTPPIAPATTAAGTTAGPEATEYVEDAARIEDLWRRHNLAWLSGFESGVQFWVDHNYPDMACTFDDYVRSRYPNGPADGLLIERVANGPTIRRDDGWIIPGGRLEGTPARGRVYVMSIQETRTDSVSDPAPPVALDLHVTILDERAHFFFGCS